MAKSDRDGDSGILEAISDLRRGVDVEANARRVFERYFPWVRRYFSRLGYSPEDAEDLAQDVFSQVFRRLDSYRGDSPFESWLFAVAANLHRNDGRRRRRDKRRAPEVSIDEAREAQDASEGVAWEPVARDRLPPREIFERERWAALEASVRALPPQMRQVLRLRIVQDLKLREVAVVLGISVDTVKSHLFQARQRLRAELGDDYAEWPPEDSH
jgi:RNA polymerase sigma-70 factor, ECF subfamily